MARDSDLYKSGNSFIDTDQPSQLRQIGAYHMIGDDSYEPQRNNNFELRIYGLDNLTFVGDQPGIAGGDVDQAEAEGCLTLSTVSVGSVNTNINPISIPYGNTKVKFAGLPDVQDSTVVFNDYIGKRTERIIAAWHALVFNPNTQKIGRASNYKKPALLIETAPDGTNARMWLLKGCWPSSVTYGDYDYNGGAVRQIQMTLTYDIAIPLPEGQAGWNTAEFNQNVNYRGY